MRKCATLLSVALGASCLWAAGQTGYYAQITMDGDFADWASVPAFYDESGTNDYADGAFDCRYVKCANDGTAFMLMWETREALAFGGAAWGYQWYLDTDRSATSGFHGAGGWMTNGYDYLLEGATLYRYTGDGQSWSWAAAGAGTYAYLSNRIELAVARAGLSDAFVLFGSFGTNGARDTVPYENEAQVYAMAAAPPPASYFAHITVDGDGADWAGIPPLVKDASADYITNGAFADIAAYDVTNVYVANDEEHVFVRLDLRGAVDPTYYGVYMLYVDTDCSVTSGLTWGWWTMGADRRTLLTDWVHAVSPTGVVQAFMGSGPSDNVWGWGGVVFSTLVENVWCASGGNVIEYGLPRSALAATNDGAVIAVLAHLVENDLGGDGDAAPMFNAPPAYYMMAVPEPLGAGAALALAWWALRRSRHT